MAAAATEWQGAFALRDTSAWKAVVDSVCDASPLALVDTTGRLFAAPRAWDDADMAAKGASGAMEIPPTTTESAVHLRRRKIGVLDSSFNPPTLAHERLLRLADSADAVGPFDMKVLMVAKANADKAIVGAQLHERLAMMQQMALAQPQVDASPVALCVTSYALFVDKARVLLRYLCCSESDGKFTVYFIVGSDTLVRIFNPKYYADPEKELGELFTMVHIVSFDRDKASVQQTNDVMDSPLARRFADSITRLDLDDPRVADISSTLARQVIRDGDKDCSGGVGAAGAVDAEDFGSLLLPGVEAFIREHAHMYATS
eukprot:TRINITY_DN38062_c0_g1_i1.p1 TRINITY_DN38062_c0_g1~~TRINITY_DN38062_c0_g1_i1.p1  ORF type:complete len:370 (-),score=71.37 TRINITY_DN38062_c0_g1_i1:51-998(-)